MAGFIVGEIVSVLGADRAALYSRGPARRTCSPRPVVRPSGLGERVLADWVARNDKAVGLPPLPDTSLESRPAGVAADAAVDGVVADGIYLPLQTQDSLEGVLYARPLAGLAFSPDAIRLLIAISNLAASFLERRRLEERGGCGDRPARRRPAEDHTRLVRLSRAQDAARGGDRARHRPARRGGELRRCRACARSSSPSLRTSAASTRPSATCSTSRASSPTPGGRASRTTTSRRCSARLRRASPRCGGHGSASRCPRGCRRSVSTSRSGRGRCRTSSTTRSLYSPARGGGPRRCARAGRRRCSIWVEDRGPGVPDAEKERVFEKFYRGSASAAVSPSGTGLGLAIAHEIARTHGGRVWVEDARPNGARFVISLPLGGGGTMRRRRTAAPERAAAHPRHRRRGADPPRPALDPAGPPLRRRSRGERS